MTTEPTPPVGVHPSKIVRPSAPPPEAPNRFHKEVEEKGWEDLGDFGIDPEGAEWVKRRLKEHEVDALVDEWERSDRCYDADWDMGTFVLYREGFVPQDYANTMLLREQEIEERKAAAGKSNAHLDFWNSFPKIHPKNCTCLECKGRDFPALMTEEENEELDKLRKTVTVATRTGLAADEVDELYVGIGIPRAEILKQPQFQPTDEDPRPWYVLEAYVELAGKVKAGQTTEEEGKTPDHVFGPNLFALFRDKECLIGYHAGRGGYLVGQIGDLLSMGVVLPKSTFIARNVEHWLPLDRINYQKALEADRGRNRKVPNKDKEATETAEKAPKEQLPCACGCGQMTGSKFAMGHDSKLRGQIHRVLEGREDPDKIPSIAYERCGSKVIQRFNADTHQLEEINVPDAHFSHDKGQKAFAAWEESERKKAENEAAKAKKAADDAAAKEAEKAAAAAGAGAPTA